MDGVEVNILAGSKVVLDLLDELNKKRVQNALELKPIASGELPTPPAEPVDQDYKMEVCGGTNGATFTHATLSGGSKTLTNKEIGLFWFDHNTRAWSFVKGQELPKGADGKDGEDGPTVIFNTEQEGYFITDDFGNVIMRIDEFDVAKISDSFISKLDKKNEIEVFEHGDYITDEQGYVLMRLDELDVQSISDNFKKLLYSKSIGMSNELLIPSKMYFLRGKENNIYFNQLLAKKLLKGYYDINVSGTGLQFFTRRVKNTPSSLNNINATAELYNAEYDIMQSKSFTIHVGDNTKTAPIKILKIGDSWTSPSFGLKPIYDNTTNVTFLGTLTGHSSVNQSIKHEGRAGWTLANFFNPAFTRQTGAQSTWLFTPFMQPTNDLKYKGQTATWINNMSNDKGILYVKGIEMGINPTTGLPNIPQLNDLFWVSSESTYKYYDGSSWVNLQIADVNLTFNYAKYREVFLIDNPDLFLFELGINDFAAQKTLSGFENAWSAFKTNLDILISQLKADNPSIKIGIHLPFNSFSDAATSTEFVGLKNIMMSRCRKNLITYYDNRTSDNIYLVDTSSAIDSNYAFWKTATVPFQDYTGTETELVFNDVIHPTSYYQVGISTLAFIQYIR